MPEHMRDNSKLYGIELDSISGRIAQKLYPSAKIKVQGFEKTSYNDNSFDIVVGNVPFGDFKVADKKYDKYNFQIHDYFFAKSIDKVKPNGIIALVTSKGTLDKKDDKVRTYIAERCDLIGAVRLPNDTFKGSAGTEATSDIIFLQKKEKMTAGALPDWVKVSQTADEIPLNSYFIKHPDMILGTMKYDNKMFGENSSYTTCTPHENHNLAAELENALSKLSAKISTKKAEETLEIIPADPNIKNYTFAESDGSIYFRENETMTKVIADEKTLNRIRSYIQVKNAVFDVIEAQKNNCSDNELISLQSKLNDSYDNFKRKYEYISDKTNEKVFDDDDDYNTLSALEVPIKDSKDYSKSDIFTKRTVNPYKEITSTETADEALTVSMDRLGKVDVLYISQLCGRSPEETIQDLKGQIYLNPVTYDKEDRSYSGYELASEYLSGNVRKKLKTAELFASTDDIFYENVEALKKVIPKNLEANEISVRISANWVDTEDYAKFFNEYAHGSINIFMPLTRDKSGEYRIQQKGSDRSVAATSTYGTNRMNSYEIFESLLNQRDTVVRDRYEDEDGHVRYVTNAKETQLATEKAKQMQEAFKRWFWQDIDRREKYEKKYNELFNSIVGREYDGSHQTFPGMSPLIKLKPHQLNTIAHAKYGGNTLFAHCVGAGKSFEMLLSEM